MRKGGEGVERGGWGQSGSGDWQVGLVCRSIFFFALLLMVWREAECVYIAMTRSVYDFVGSLVCSVCLYERKRRAQEEHKKSKSKKKS